VHRQRRHHPVYPHMNIFITARDQHIDNTQGVCGSYDFDPDNDSLDAQGNPGESDASALSWAVPSKHSFFPYRPVVSEKLTVLPPVAAVNFARNVTDLTASRVACSSGRTTKLSAKYFDACVLDVLHGKDCVVMVLHNTRLTCCFVRWATGCQGIDSSAQQVRSSRCYSCRRCCSVHASPCSLW
jgi:hypothetical protein